MANELKIVITLKEGRGTIGVKSPDCDPVLVNFEGELDEALKGVPELVKKAEEQWAQSPQYPKGEVPAPPAPKTVERQPVRAASAPKSSEKPLMF